MNSNDRMASEVTSQLDETSCFSHCVVDEIVYYDPACALGI